MQVTLSGSQSRIPQTSVLYKSAPPTHISSSIQKYQQTLQSLIQSKQQSLPQFYIENVLHYSNPQIPRLLILDTALKVIKNYLSTCPANSNNPTINMKYINTLFLQQSAVMTLIQESQSLIDIGYVMQKNGECKVKGVEYSADVLNVLKNSVEMLVRKGEDHLDSLFCVREVVSFVEQKQRIPESLYIMDVFERDQNQLQICIIFNYVFKILFEKRTPTNIYDCLYPMVYWFVIVKDENVQKQIILMEIAKKIDSYLWLRKTADNINFIKMFTKILDLLSCKHHQNDSYCSYTLAPLLIKLRGNIPYYDLINNWLATSQHNKTMLPKLIQSIFRNSLFSGCSVFCFQIIQTFSNQLHRKKDYQTLFHIFDSFIRKDYLSIKLPNSTFVRSYMNILMFYAIGFINRDRLDGETELDRLADNLCQLVCKPKFKYDQCYVEIIKFFRIYEVRFQFLSNTSKNFVKKLESIYSFHLPIASLHQQVANRIFKQYSADYDDAQIYALQKSSRYAGLTNLGNTCYMNSFIQSLFMTKKFKTMVIKAQDEGIVPANHPIFQALVHLFSQLSSKTNQNKTEVVPTQFKKHIPQPFKSSYEQHDTGEFGRMYLDLVTSQLKDTVLADKINRLFTQHLITKIICKNCNTARQKNQKIFDFILNIHQNSTQIITVSELLKQYFRGYELDDKNMIYCDRCRKNTLGVVMHEPNQLAEHLITTISIFKYDKNGSSKIIKPLNFQFTLNFKNILPKLVNDDEIYELYSFVLHIGTGVQRGHYQCFARNLEENPMLWYKFDDHYVTQQEINSINDFHFGENQTPYILFYINSNKSRKFFTKK